LSKPNPLAKDGSYYGTLRADRNQLGPQGQLPLHPYSEVSDTLYFHYGADGSYLWHTFWGCSASTFHVNEQGNLIATGASSEPWYGPDATPPRNPFRYPLEPYDSVRPDICFLQLDTRGEYLWHTFFGGEDLDDLHWLLPRPDGNLLAAGYSWAPWTGPSGEAPLHPFNEGDGEWLHPEILLLTVTREGEYIHHAFLGSGDADFISELIVLPDGSILLAGTSYASWTGPDGETPLHPFSGEHSAFVAKLNPGGEYLWHTFAGNGFASAEALAPTANGSIAVVGYSSENWTGPEGEPARHPHCNDTDIFVFQLSPDGAYQWHTFLGACAGPDGDPEGMSADFGDAIAIDAAGNLIIAGRSGREWSGPQAEPSVRAFSDSYYELQEDIVLIGLSPAGDYLWHGFWGGRLDDRVQSMFFSENQNLFILGYSAFEWALSDDNPPLNSGPFESGAFEMCLSP